MYKFQLNILHFFNKFVYFIFNFYLIFFIIKIIISCLWSSLKYSHNVLHNIIRMIHLNVWSECSCVVSQCLVNLGGSYCSIDSPLHCLICQIYCRFHCLSFFETIALLYIWRKFIPPSRVTHCIIGFIWWLLISLFRLINDTDHNSTVIWFDYFELESDLLIVGHNLVENKLSKFPLSLIFYCAAGGSWCYFKFVWIRLH